MANENLADHVTIDVVIPSVRMDSERLSSLLKIDVPSDIKLRYYIVLDNTHISTKEFQNKYPVKIIQNKRNLGAHSSRNIGFETGTGDYVLFIDDDVTPSPNILHAYLTAIRNDPEAPGYVGITKFPSPINSFTRGIHASDILTFFDLARTREFMAWGTTSNLIVSRRKIGSIRFSTEFPKSGGGEDIDFCLRVIAGSDKRFRTVPQAIVEHNWWKGGRRTYSRFFRWAYGDSRLPKLHPTHRFHNFPNMIETLTLGVPLLVVLSLFDLYSLHSIGIWLVAVIISEFAVERIRAKQRFPNLHMKSAIEAAVVRLSNDLGRLAGVLRRRDVAGFFERFDYFTTRESIWFERKIARVKFFTFAVLAVLTYLLQ